MELFNKDGHLTDEGINELILERLNELQRLEAAEHLSFCDECILKYTERLESAVLYNDAPDVLPRVKQSLRKRLVRIAVSKYSAAAAAVAMAIIIGGSGIFAGGMPSVPKGGDTPVQNSFLSGFAVITDTISGFFYREPNVPKISDVKIPKPKDIVVPKAPKAVADKKDKDDTEQKQKAALAENPAKASAKPQKNPAEDIAKKQNIAFDLLNPKHINSN